MFGWLKRFLRKKPPAPFDWQKHCEARGFSSEVIRIATELAIAREEKLTINSAAKSYNSFSGSDIKAYWSYEGEMAFYRDANEYGEWSKKYHCVPELQYVSFKSNYGYAEPHDTEGTLTFVVFDRSVAQQLPQSTNLFLVACNEYGNMAIMSFHNLRKRTLSYGVSVDDIVSEERVDFKAERMQPWRKLR